MKKLLLCLMLVTVGIVFGADDMNSDDFSPWEYWRKGFEAFERGEQLINAQQNQKALVEFLNAKRAFLQVKQARPEWRQDVIMQRVKLCDERISRLQRPVKLDTNYRDDQFTFSGSGKELSPASASTSREVTLLKAQLKNYREKLFSALVKLEEYRNKDKRSGNALNEIENLIKEKSDLSRKYQLLMQKYSILQQKQKMPQVEKTALDNQLLEAKMRSDLLEQKIKMYQNNIIKLEKDIIALKQNNSKDKISAKQSIARVTALEDEIKRLSRNAETYRERARKASLDLEKQKYINEIEQRNAKRYKERLATLNKWLNNRDKTKAASINQQVALENISITKQLASLQDSNDSLMRESMVLKKKLSEAHANITQLKNLISSIESQKQELAQRLNKSSDRARKSSGTSSQQTKEIEKLRQENSRLREDLNLFGKSYEKRTSPADTETVSRYKLIIDKLNAELANVKAGSEQYKLTHKSRQDEIMKLEDSVTKLKNDNLDLNEENKNLKAFVKDYENIAKNNEALKKRLELNRPLEAQLARYKKDYQQQLEKNKSLQGKIVQLQQDKTKTTALSGKAATATTKLEKEFKELQKQNILLKKKTAEYNAIISHMEKEQKALASNIAKDKKAKTARQALLRKTEVLESTVKQLQQKNISIAKQLNRTRQSNNTSINALKGKNSELKQLKATLNKKQNEIKQKLTTQTTEIARLKTLLTNSRKENAKYKNQLAQRIKQAVKIKKTAPQQLPGKLSEHQIAFLLQEGIQAEKNNDYEAAAWHYQKIISNIPVHPEANRRLGLISLNQGLYGKATQQLEKALRAAPEDTELLLAFAAALSRNSKPSAALNTIKQAIKIDPRNSRAHILYGSIMIDLKKNREAESSFLKALSLAPESAEANLKIAQLLSIDKQRRKDAEKYYRKAVKLGAANDPMLDKIFTGNSAKNESEAVSALRQMAIKHESKKDYVAAAWCYSQLLDMDREDPQLLLKYANILLLANKPDQTLPMIKKALIKGSDKLTALLLLGANHLMLSNYSDAAKAYRQALPLLKASPEYRPPVTLKELNSRIKKQLGDKAGKEFEIIIKR